jgi:hypothetical protein
MTGLMRGWRINFPQGEFIVCSQKRRVKALEGEAKCQHLNAEAIGRGCGMVEVVVWPTFSGNKYRRRRSCRR